MLSPSQLYEQFDDPEISQELTHFRAFAFAYGLARNFLPLPPLYLEHSPTVSTSMSSYPWTHCFVLASIAPFPTQPV